MIPRTIHHVWLGDRPVPELFRTLREMVEFLHPEWSFTMWRDQDVEELGLTGRLAEAYAAAPVGVRSDIVRFAVLQRLGGWYLDADVEPLQPLDPLCGMASCVVGREDDAVIGTAVLAAEPGHPLLGAAVDALADSFFDNADHGVMAQTGPAFFTRVCARWSAGHDGSAAPLVADPQVFYPVHWSQQDDFDRLRVRAMLMGRAYTVHHWAGSWRDDTDPWRLTADRLISSS